MEGFKMPTEGTLYDVKGMRGVYTLDAEMTDLEVKKFEAAADQDTLQIELTTISSQAGAPDNVFIKKQYEQFFSEAGTLESVEVISTGDGKVFKEGIYPKGTKITIKGIWEIGFS